MAGCRCDKEKGVKCLLHFDLDEHVLLTALNAPEKLTEDTLGESLEELARLAGDVRGESITLGAAFHRAEGKVNRESWERLSSIIDDLVSSRNAIKAVLAEADQAALVDEIIEMIDDGPNFR